MRTAHIVFYGTLRRGHPKHAELGLPRALRYIGERSIAGDLYDLGDYPGLVDGTGSVDVELYRVLDRSVLGHLDRYEGYDAARPDRSLFVRGRVRVPLIAGAAAPACSAWVYRFNGRVDERERIARADGERHTRRRWHTRR